MLASEIVGAVAGKKDVRTAIEEAPGEADRSARGPQSGNCAGPSVAAVHDCGVKLNAAGRGEHASSTRIEADILFQDPHRGLDRVESAFAFRKDRRACGERLLESGERALFLLGVEPAGLHRARATMNH